MTALISLNSNLYKIPNPIEIPLNEVSDLYNFIVRVSTPVERANAIDGDTYLYEHTNELLHFISGIRITVIFGISINNYDSVSASELRRLTISTENWRVSILKSDPNIIADYISEPMGDYYNIQADIETFAQSLNDLHQLKRRELIDEYLTNSTTICRRN